MLNLPVFEKLVVRDYRLFPGKANSHELVFEFQDGVSLIAGINGLGKTTLINIMYRLAVGPWDLPKETGNRFGGVALKDVTNWTARTRYFSQRVADAAENARASLAFRLGSNLFVIERRLSNCRLTSASKDGQAIEIDAEESQLKSTLTEAAGLGSYVDFVTVVKYLTFFNEERRDLLWDEQAQRQLARILFVAPDDANRWSELEVLINKADSKARNASADAFRMERELKILEEELRKYAGVGDELAAAQQVLDADLQRQKQLEDDILELERERKDVVRTLERTKIVEDDARRALEEIRYGSLSRLFPNLNDTARYVLTHLFAEGRCLACEADAPDKEFPLEMKGHVFSAFFLSNWARLRSLSLSLPQQRHDIFLPLTSMMGTFDGGGIQGTAKLLISPTRDSQLTAA